MKIQLYYFASSKGYLRLLIPVGLVFMTIALTMSFTQNEEDKLIPVQVLSGYGEYNGYRGYSNLDGTLVVSPKYVDARPFSEGLASVGISKLRVNKNGLAVNITRFGCINEKGKMVIKPKFTVVQKFEDGLAIARKGKYMGLINKKGKEVIPIKYEFGQLLPKKFTEGLVYAFKDGKYGFIDKSGTWIIEPLYDEAASFYKGVAMVKKDGLYGYIDKQGEVLIPFIYEFADLYNGSTLVSEDKYDIEKYFYMDKQGNEKELDSLYLPVASVVDNAGWVRTRELFSPTYCLIDSSMNVVKTTDYDKVRFFENGIARVEKNKKVGYINAEGVEIVPPIYGFGREFENDYACVCAKANEKYSELGTGCGVIDKKGNLLIDTIYTSPVKLSENRFAQCNFWDGVNQDLVYFDLQENREVFRSSNRN